MHGTMPRHRRQRQALSDALDRNAVAGKALRAAIAELGAALRECPTVAAPSQAGAAK